MHILIQSKYVHVEWGQTSEMTVPQFSSSLQVLNLKETVLIYVSVWDFKSAPLLNSGVICGPSYWQVCECGCLFILSFNQWATDVFFCSYTLLFLLQLCLHLDMKKCVELYFSGYRLCNYGYMHVLIAQMAGCLFIWTLEVKRELWTVINLSSDTRYKKREKGGWEREREREKNGDNRLPHPFII